MTPVTTINGITLTSEMQDVLEQWQEKDSILQVHIESLNDTQDFLCRLLNESYLNAELGVIGTLLAAIVCVKDDLKNFIVTKGGDQ